MSTERVRCQDGPYRGKYLQLERGGDLCTVSFRVGGWSGRYVKGNWEPTPGSIKG